MGKKQGRVCVCNADWTVRMASDIIEGKMMGKPTDGKKRKYGREELQSAESFNLGTRLIQDII